MTTRTVLGEVNRLLGILGPRWVDAAEPLIFIGHGWATVQIASHTTCLVERMALVDQAARVIEADPAPRRGVEDSGTGFWGAYGTPPDVHDAGRLNGVPLMVSTIITVAEMHPEAVPL